MPKIINFIVKIDYNSLKYDFKRISKQKNT